MFGHVCPFVGVTMSDDSLLEYSELKHKTEVWTYSSESHKS